MSVLSQFVSWIAESPLFSATFMDWLDIGILAAIIYHALLLIRGTRALQSLIGLVLLGFVYLLSKLLGMTTLHWVLDNLVVYIVLAIVILFQDDIKMVLASAGGTLFSRNRAMSNVHLIEELVQAVFSLAHNKVGALIVLERTASLEVFTNEGLAIDGKLSAELLQSIFHPTSPIHDGAVVITGNRVRAAGVFLPLSISSSLSKAYGTRHRAAMGLSDSTDSVVIVVSEERGTVTLSIGGELIPVADNNDLRDRLQGLFSSTKADEVIEKP